MRLLKLALVVCFLLLLSGTADAGIFKRFKERRSGGCSGGSCGTASATSFEQTTVKGFSGCTTGCTGLGLIPHK